MLNIDFFFTYKYSLRFLILSKLGISFFKNSYQIPFLWKLFFFFPLVNSMDKHQVSYLNYFYLFSFFFGKCAFLSKYKSKFILGNWYYNFNIFISIYKKDIYNILFFFLNDIVYKINSNDIYFGIISLKSNILYLIIEDLNIFSDKKTNFGLFYLEDILSLHFFIKGGDINSSRIILKNLKIKSFN